MFRIEELARACRCVGDILREIAAQHPRLEPGRHAHELIRRLITRMIEDVIAREPAAGIAELEPALGRQTCAAPAGRWSDSLRPWRAADRAIKDFLYPRLYRHARIMRIMGEAEEMVRRLFDHYVGRRPAICRRNGSAGLDPADAGGRALRIADFIAGMTDRYAMVEHAPAVRIDAGLALSARGLAAP